jgi:type IV pilus assembly protein PilA
MNRVGGHLSASHLVGVIVLFLSCLALLAPRFVDRTIAGNEAAAVSTLHAIRSAQWQYAERYPTAGFADNVAKLEPPAPGTQPDSSHANLLEPILSCSTQPCARSGYLFAIDQISGAPATNFRITAIPQVPGKTGNRGFCSTESGAITADPNGGKACSVPIA